MAQTAPSYRLSLITGGLIVLLTASAGAQQRTFGSFFYSDGSQFKKGAVAGAAPNSLATGAGVRCEYRYAVRNGQRVRYQFCE